MTETLTVNQVAPITSVPQGWQRLPLRRLFRITGGATPKSDVAEYWDGDIDWVTPADLGKTPSLEVHNSARTLTRAGLDSCAAELLPPGSIIVSVRAPIGAIGIAKVPMATNQGCKGLVGQSAEPRFMAYQLSVSQASLEAVGRGTTFTELSATDLGSFQVAVPPPDLQRTIANFLDRETDKIDALIDKQQQLIATLREDRAATVTHAVTKGLDPNAPLRETGTKWVDTIPENWTLSRFSRHISINSGQVDPRLEPYRDMTLIAPNHVESKTGKLLETESAEEQGADSGKYLVSAGQVIYSKIRPNLAKVTIAPVDCLCSADMYGLSTDPNELFSEFLLYELLSQPFTDYVIDSSMRVAMPKVNHDSLGAAPIWFPPIEEQYKVVEFLDARCASIDALIDKSTEMIETLREYRSALITNAVTGKIDVREAV
ncbi:restriction endonuclease subunit S [Dietzia maris]